MKPILLTILFCLFLSTTFAEENLVPQEITWNDDVYVYDPYWKEHETIKYGDFDGDSEDEVVVSFMGGIKEDIFVHRPFYLIYDVVNGKNKLAKTIIGNMYLGDIRIIDLEQDGQKEIAIFSGGGAHYKNIYIYKYKNGVYDLVFENGSACRVETDFEAEPPTITVGRANWEQEGWSYASGNPLWQVYAWDGKEFVYNKKLSTTSEISEPEATQRYVDEVKKVMEKNDKCFSLFKWIAIISIAPIVLVFLVLLWAFLAASLSIASSA